MYDIKIINGKRVVIDPMKELRDKMNKKEQEKIETRISLGTKENKKITFEEVCNLMMEGVFVWIWENSIFLKEGKILLIDSYGEIKVDGNKYSLEEIFRTRNEAIDWKIQELENSKDIER